MGIQRLLAHGFRSLLKIEWKPGKLNLFVGPNGSGKSNVLQLLDLIGATARGDLARTIREAGGVYPLLWNGESTDFGWEVAIDPVDEGRDPTRDAITYDLTLGQVGIGGSYEILLDSLANRCNPEKTYSNYERRLHRANVFNVQAQTPIRLRDDDFDPNESLLSQIGDPTNPIPRHAKRFFESWRMYQDVRADRGSPMRRPQTTQPTKYLSPDGSNLANVLHTLYTNDRGFKEQIDEGMRAAFGSDYERLEIVPASSGQVQLSVRWNSCKEPHAAPDLSDGTLRFLFLLTTLASPELPGLVAIDEPETGLHPSMLPIIADYAAAAAERTQVILSSHSPEFLDCFSTLEPTITVFHWEHGQTRLFPIAPERLATWLSRYRLGQLFTSGELDSLSLPDVDADREATVDG